MRIAHLPFCRHSPTRLLQLAGQSHVSGVPTPGNISAIQKPQLLLMDLWIARGPSFVLQYMIALFLFREGTKKSSVQSASTAFTSVPNAVTPGICNQVLCQHRFTTHRQLEDCLCTDLRCEILGVGVDGTDERRHRERGAVALLWPTEQRRVRNAPGGLPKERAAARDTRKSGGAANGEMVHSRASRSSLRRLVSFRS